ncbi:S8 family serine peptidase [Flavobacterium sp.]|uniref:S8 family serine peptidase n=1 Tax=Flavobacterium sp. TaxID=239 RepID=UPI003529252A
MKNSVLCILLMLTFSQLYSQSTEDKRKTILSKSDAKALKNVVTQFSNAFEQEQQKIRASRFPKLKSNDSVQIELEKINEQGVPIYLQSHNTLAAQATRTNYLQDFGGLDLNLQGQDMVFYVWDSGHPRVTHEEFKGNGNTVRVTLEDVMAEGGGDYTHYHATHVTGTLLGNGRALREAKGMAPRATAKNYRWTNHFTEVTQAALEGALLTNHSYGWYNNGLPTYEFGNYSSTAADWDLIMHNAPHLLLVFSAGNDGQANYNSQPIYTGFDKISGHQCAKNNLVVANATSIVLNELGELVSASINASSSQGPMDELRIKPDVAGKGTQVTSAYSTSNFSCSSLTGTSMATPNVTGSLMLWQEFYHQQENGFMKAATLKALALHTADDILPQGPDAYSGWGLLNSKKAIQTIQRKGKTTEIIESTLVNGQTYTLPIVSDGIHPLQLSLCWTDLPGVPSTALNSSHSRLINDLDVRITQNGTTYYPIRLLSPTTSGTGDNAVDPYERITIAVASGNYTVEVTHKGTLTGGVQPFSLVITGVNHNCTTAVPTDLKYSSITSSSVVIKWRDTDARPYWVRYKKTTDSLWQSIETTQQEILITGLQALTDYEVQIQSFCGAQSSDFSTLLTFTTLGNYCTSSGSLYRNIRMVQLNDYTNNTLIYNQGYHSFHEQPIRLVKGENNTLQLTTTPYSFGAAVWIDYNRNGLFNDPGELVYSRASSTVNPITGSFTIPLTVNEGTTAMRIAIKQNALPTLCETAFSGQVQDYTVQIVTTLCNGQTIWNGTSWSNGTPTLEKEVIVTGNYQGPGFSCCSITVQGNALFSLNEGQNLIVVDSVTVAPLATLHIPSSSNLLQQKSTANSTPIHIQTETTPLKRLDYVLWSSPVVGQNLLDFSPQTVTNRFYRYQSATNNYQSVDPSVTDFNVGESYLIRMPNNHPTFPTPWVGTFDGIPHNGDYTLTVPVFQYVATGNPYPSAFDLFQFAAENGIQDPIYFWRKENNTATSSYATYTLFLGGLSNSGDPFDWSPRREVRPGQGFIVFTRNNQLKFKNYMRTGNTASPMLRMNTPKNQSHFDDEVTDLHRIILQLSGPGTLSSNMMVAYLPEATSGEDAFIDGRYINDNPNALTSLINGEEFTIQGRGLPLDINDIVPLSFKTDQSGTFQIDMLHGSGLFNAEQAVYLVDHVLGIIHPISTMPYVFDSTSGVYSSRFTLQFTDESLSLPENNIQLIQVSTRENSVFISSFTQLISQARMYDITGKVVINKQTVNNKSLVIPTETVTKGVYMLSLTMESGEVVVKKLIL